MSLPGGSPRFVRDDVALYAYYDSGSWRSVDGRSWQSLDLGEVPTVHRLLDGPGGVVLAEALFDECCFAEPGSRPLLLWSKDSVKRTRPSQPPSFGGDEFWFRQVVATDNGFLLLAYEPGLELVLWTSPDGDVWNKVEGDVPFDVVDVFSDPSAEANIGAATDNVAITTTREFTTLWRIEIVSTQ